mmetsp:Transcript_6452/g.14084  ORF Transcript_6452/g.14084 Transcript_6452/m.14084 type:complete len:115 (+) Transcript_6452:67-411(+)
MDVDREEPIPDEITDQMVIANEHFMHAPERAHSVHKLDNDGILTVRQRFKEIVALLTLEKMRRKIGFETSVLSLLVGILAVRKRFMEIATLLTLDKMRHKIGFQRSRQFEGRDG